MGGLLCCSSKEQDWKAEVLRESGPKVELEGVSWDQRVAEESWEAVFQEPGVEDDDFREASPELSKDMASFPFSPRPLSPGANSANGDAPNSVVDAHFIRNSGVQNGLQLPDLLSAFRTSASSSAPFSASTPGSPSGQRPTLESGTSPSDVLPLGLKVENNECESKTLGSHMAIFPASLPLLAS